MKEKRINILYLFPGPTHRPDLPDFKDRFIDLSEFSQGEIYSWTWNEEYEEVALGDFKFLGFNKTRNKFAFKLKYALFILKNAFKSFSKKKFDVIICYEAIFTGVIGAILRIFFKCKLIIELNNSDMFEAMQLEGGTSLKTRFKMFISRVLRHFSLSTSDGIKLLTQQQKNNLEERFHKKHVFIYHDFVPTQYFEEEKKTFGKYLLFVGHPFYRKGIDVAVRAFEKIAEQFPDFELHLIGHLLEDEAKRYLKNWHERVKFIKPMFYEELQPRFLNCYGFVLPSREEGMGRVLIEAMACAKPLIGANVGGIPDLIRDGKNGYLFESGNSDDLADKFELLLSDESKARSMGQKGKQMVNEKYSSVKYYEHFKKMIHEVCCD